MATNVKSVAGKLLGGAALVGAMAAFGPTANAALTVDNRLTVDMSISKINGVTQTAGLKSATVNVGDVLTLVVKGLVTNANGVNSSNDSDGLPAVIDDAMQSAFIAQLKSTGTIHGNMGGMSVGGLFKGTGYQVGTVQDVDGDGDLDIGSAYADPSLASDPTAESQNMFGPRASEMKLPSTAADAEFATNPITFTNLGTLTFTVTGVGSGTTLLNAVSRIQSNANAQAAVFRSDGVNVDMTGTVADPKAFGVGSAVQLTAVPEPASLGLLGLGLLGLAARRRRA
jgi:hypothetical protein